MATNRTQAGSTLFSGSNAKSNATFSQGSSASNFLDKLGGWTFQWGSPPKYVWLSTPSGTLPHAGSPYTTNDGDGYTTYGSIKIPTYDTVDIVQGFSDTFGDVTALEAPYSQVRNYQYSQSLNIASSYRYTDRMYFQFDAALATQESASSSSGVQVGYQYKLDASASGVAGPSMTWSFRRNTSFKGHVIDVPQPDYSSGGSPATNYTTGPFPHQGGSQSFEDRGVEFRYKDDGTNETKEIRFRVYNSLGLETSASDWEDVSDEECLWELLYDTDRESNVYQLRERFLVGGEAIYDEYWPDEFMQDGNATSNQDRNSTLDNSYREFFWTYPEHRYGLGPWYAGHPIANDLGVALNRNSVDSTDDRDMLKRPSSPRQIYNTAQGLRNGWDPDAQYGWLPFTFQCGIGEWSFENLTVSTGKCVDWDYGQKCDRGAASFSISNMEFGFGGASSANANNQWLGPNAKTGIDWDIPSGGLSSYAVTYQKPSDEEKFPLLPWRSNITPKTQSMNRYREKKFRRFSNLSYEEAHQFEEGWAGAWDFGIESGSLPEGVVLKWGSMVKVDTVASGQSGTVQLYAIGLSGHKILSPTYSWSTGSKLEAFYEEGSSSSPLNKETYIGDCVWIVGDPSYRALPTVTGGTAPYTFTLLDDGYRDPPYSDVPVANRLPFDTSDGGFGPLPNNSLSTHFLSSRGIDKPRVRVTDSVGDYVDVRPRLQVIWPSSGIAEHYMQEYPTYALRLRTDELTDWYDADPNYDFTFFEDRYCVFSWLAIDRVLSQMTYYGSLSVVSGSLPTGFLQGLDTAKRFKGFDYAHQYCIHKETSETTGTCVLQLQMPEGDIVQSQEFSWICKVAGDYLTFGYEDPFVHPNGSADANYDHVWADGGYTLEVLEESLPDREIRFPRWRLSAGTLPEGVTLNTVTGDLTMSGSVLGSEATGSYTIEMTCSDHGYRENTYTWKREGLGGI